MRKKFEAELEPDLKLKVKKNMVYLAIFSIIMMFAGLTSAYIVSMGDTFWVKYPLPTGFWLSTAAIVLSSILYILAIRFSKQGKFKMLRLFMLLTFVSAIAFVYFQFKGYSQLVDKGAQVRNSVMVTEGRYGDYFTISYLGKQLEVNANDYLVGGKILSEKQMEELEQFLAPFEKTTDPKGYQLKINNLSPNFVLFLEGEPVRLQNHKLVTSSGKELQYLDMKRLCYLYWNVRDRRGDFFYKGKLGKDFKIFYKGKELAYKNRNLYYNNKVLSAPMQLKINQARDTGSSYLYIITFLHLLHVLAALIYLFRMVLITLKPELTPDNQLSIRLGSIFWHFLGILWLYLLVFLLFIH